MKSYEVTVRMEVYAETSLIATKTVESALNIASNLQILKHIDYFDVDNVELLDEESEDAD